MWCSTSAWRWDSGSCLSASNNPATSGAGCVSACAGMRSPVKMMRDHSFDTTVSATLSVTGNKARKTRGGPYLPGIAFAPAPRLTFTAPANTTAAVRTYQVTIKATDRQGNESSEDCGTLTVAPGGRSHRTIKRVLNDIPQPRAGQHEQRQRRRAEDAPLMVELLGGETKPRLPAYCTGNDIEQHVEFGYKRLKLAIPHGPADGLEGMRKNVELVQRARKAFERGELVLAHAGTGNGTRDPGRACRA